MTKEFLLRLETLARRCDAHVCNDAPSLMSPNFLLREQIIGEARGYRMLRSLAQSEIDKLSDELKNENENPD
jgi:hypothetical protein